MQANLFLNGLALALKLSPENQNKAYKINKLNS